MKLAPFTNAGAKVLCLVLACAAWWGISAEKRQRMTEKAYKVPLSVVNIPANVAIVSKLPDAVELRLRGPQSGLRGLRGERLEVWLDLLSADAGERTYPVSAEGLDLPDGVTIAGIFPQSLPLELDEMRERTLRVTPVVRGTPAEGKKVVRVDCVPWVVTVWGPKGILEGRRELPTEPIDVSGRAASFATNVRPQPESPYVRVVSPAVVQARVEIE